MLAERPCGQDTAREADDDQAGHVQRQLGRIADEDRKLGQRQAGRYVADRGEAVRAQVQDCRQQQGQDHDDRRSGDTRGEPLEQPQHDEQAEAQGHGRPVDLGAAPDQLDERAEQARRLQVDMGKARQLADQQGERDAGEIADEHRP